MMKQESTRLISLNKHAITNVHEKSITTRKMLSTCMYVITYYVIEGRDLNAVYWQREVVCRMVARTLYYQVVSRTTYKYMHVPTLRPPKLTKLVVPKWGWAYSRGNPLSLAYRPTHCIP